jgi:hypothetical protein
MSTTNGTDPTEAQKETQLQGAASQVAASEGGGKISFEDLRNRPSLIEELFAPGIDRDGDDLPDGVASDLEDALAADFGRHLGMGNITREEYERERDLDKARRLEVLQGYPRRGRSGSACTGEVREIMVGDDDPEKPTLTDDRARQLKRAYEERSMLRSLSIGARGWRGITEFLAVTGTVGTDGEDTGDSGGMLSSLTSKLP